MMINAHYNMSIQDMDKFKDMKNTPMYRDYVQDVVSSPLFKAINKEHISDIDVTEDLKKLQEEMKLTPSELNKVFKKALSKMAVCIAADTIIMKEIIDLGIDDAKDDIDDNFKVKYLLGIAEPKFYERAEEEIKKNPDTNSVLYRGLAEHIKLKEQGSLTITVDEGKKIPESKKTTSKAKKSGLFGDSEIKF